MALLPTKKITALTPFTPPLTGDEEFECVQLSNSRKVTSRAFVLPTDSLLTMSGMGGSLPGSRQLISSATIQVNDGGPAGQVTLDALFTGALPANPTALVGLAPVNGIAPTWMRSDAAPALSQAITPTWSGLHTFSAGQMNAANDPFVRWSESDAAANNRVWDFIPVGEQFRGRVGDDALGAFANWLEVDRTLNVVDSVNLLATTVMVNGVNVRDATNLFNTGTVPTARLGAGVADATTWLRGDQSWQGLPGGFTGFANPTASIGLAAVNGAATTAMRSDAAPALSQAIIPTWTAQHIFSLSGATNAAVLVSSAQPQVDWNESDAAADNRRWRFEVNSERFFGRVVNDANSATNAWLDINRTANTVDSINLIATTVQFNGNEVLTTATLSTSNTWTAQQIFSLSGATNAAILLSSAQPQIDWNETDAAANNRRWRIEAQAEQYVGLMVNDANSASVAWMTVERTANVCDSVTFVTGEVFVRNAATNFNCLAFSADGQGANSRAWGFRIGGAADFQIGVMTDAGAVSTAGISMTRTGLTLDQVSLQGGIIRFNNAAGTLYASITGSATTGASTPTLGANKPGANAAVIGWLPVTIGAGAGHVPVFGN